MKPLEIDLGFEYDDRLLYDLDLPVKEIPLIELIVNADIPYLEKEGTNDWNLSPRELVDHFNREKTHAARVEKSDLNFPICIYYFRGKWIILDGVHRFTKALMNGDETIKIKRIDDQILNKIRK